jgi:hypothetical protein
VKQEIGDAMAGDVGLDAAAGGFDFRKFGHATGTLNEKACTKAGLVAPLWRARGHAGRLT